MKTSIFTKNTSKAIAFLFAATFAVSFTACTDDLMADNEPSMNNTSEAQGELLEAYGLTYQDFETPSDVMILNADTTEISVSKALADKLGITTFVNHPMGIWHQIEQLPYARKATKEQLVGDRYILTVEPATLAELIGEKEVQLNTGLYVNDDIQEGAVTRAGGIDMPVYAAKYVDGNQVIHPAVIHMTDPLGYGNGYHDADETATMTRSASNDGNYDYITPETMTVTRASAHKRILSFNQEIKMHKKFACGSESKDSIDFDLNVPIDFDLNYFITLNGGVKWKVCVPVPYVKKFEAGLDGKFAFSPEMTLGFTKEWKLDENKFKKTLVTFEAYSFTFWVGCVPVVVKCQPNLYIKLDGKVTGQANMGFKYEYENNFKSGVRYKSGDGWSIIKEFNEVKNDFTFIRPQVKVKAEAAIGIYLGMDVMIYGVAGPTVSVGPKLGTEAELTVSPFDENWNEKNCFTASIFLSVNAEAGAKLKVLGYELAEYKATFKLAGPWTLKKYPSDGTEHQVGDWDFAPEDYSNYNILIEGLQKSTEGASFRGHKDDIASWLCEMNDYDRTAAERVIKKNLMTQIVNDYGCIPTNSTLYPNVMQYLTHYRGEVYGDYEDYLEQKAGESGDMEYLAKKNWEHIIDLLSTNDDVKRFLHEKKGCDKSVHDWFVEDFGREPSESPEDLEWLTNVMVDFNNYSVERVSNKKSDNEEPIEEGWDAVKAKLQRLYPETFETYSRKCDDAFKKAMSWFNNYWVGIEPSTNPYYFDGINEHFVEALNEKGINIEIRK